MGASLNHHDTLDNCSFSHTCDAHSLLFPVPLEIKYTLCELQLLMKESVEHGSSSIIYLIIAVSSYFCLLK